MAGKLVNSSFVHLSKFGVSRQKSCSKTATSHIRKLLCAPKYTTKPTAILSLRLRFLHTCF